MGCFFGLGRFLAAQAAVEALSYGKDELSDLAPRHLCASSFNIADPSQQIKQLTCYSKQSLETLSRMRMDI